MSTYSKLVRIIYYLSTYIVFISVASSCQNKESQVFEKISVETIILQPSDVKKDEISDILALESYISLSDDILLGEMERMVIVDERIFVLDDQPKIICYDMQGSVLYKIDNQGSGPTEYVNIEDFGINQVSEELVVFDDHKRKLHYYNLKTGKYISEISTDYMAPTEIGIWDEGFFFKNIDNSRFNEQKEQLFYLLFSKTGKQIDKMFLPHDAVAEFNFDLNSFFYGENRLLFVKPFDKFVYLIKSGQITPLYEINLPNQLPLKIIEEKIAHNLLVTSGYSYGLDALYEANQILHFTFSKDGFVTSVFYDLLDDKLLYCGNRVLEKARKNCPFYSLIDGVYKDCFFALVPSSSIIRDRGNSPHPEYFPTKLLDINEENNPIIAFYKIRR